MRLTYDIIRKKSEHNDGVLGDLEEISLHQLEIEKIESIGDCKKLKILYLQNNIISKMEGLHKLKDLEYLNMALNNVTKIEGLRRCEFLKKLDLTVNFIDVDELASSCRELCHNHHLKELFLMGNPCTDWHGCKDYVVASIPNLCSFDGRKITKSERIKSTQLLPSLTLELEKLAKNKRQEKANKAPAKVYKKTKKQKSGQNNDNIKQCKTSEDPALCSRKETSLESDLLNDIDELDDDIIDIPRSNGKPTIIDVDKNGNELSEEKNKKSTKNDTNCTEHDDEECLPFTPELRVQMQREMAEEKQEKEDRDKAMRPKERNYKKEHQNAVLKARETATKLTRQCNQGGYRFYFEDDTENIYMHVEISTHLDSSLIDVDVQITYVSIIIKGKELRVNLPEECNPDTGKAERSAVSGALKLTLPKAVVRKRGKNRYATENNYDYALNVTKKTASNTTESQTSRVVSDKRNSRFCKKKTVHEILLEAANTGKGRKNNVVNIRGITQYNNDNINSRVNDDKKNVARPPMIQHIGESSRANNCINKTKNVVGKSKIKDEMKNIAKSKNVGVCVGPPPLE